MIEVLLSYSGAFKMKLKEPKFMNPINEWLLKHPAYNAMVVIILFVTIQFSVYELTKKVDAMESTVDALNYEPHQMLINSTLEGMASEDEIMEEVKSWGPDFKNWGAQRAAMKKLCSEPSKARLISDYGPMSTRMCLASM
jgi:hypothetical protein